MPSEILKDASLMSETLPAKPPEEPAFTGIVSDEDFLRALDFSGLAPEMRTVILGAVREAVTECLLDIALARPFTPAGVRKRLSASCEERLRPLSPEEILEVLLRNH